MVGRREDGGTYHLWGASQGPGLVGGIWTSSISMTPTAVTSVLFTRGDLASEHLGLNNGLCESMAELDSGPEP